MTRTETVIRWVVAVVLGGIGGAAGFKHTHDWAVANGQHGWLAWAVAVVVEGIAVVAGLEIRRDHQRGHHKRITFPVLVLVVGFGIQMAAQVALAPRTPAGWLLAAMPALGFLTVVKLLLRNTSTTPAQATTTPPASPTAVTVVPTTADTDTTPVPPVPARPLRLPAGMQQALTDVARQAATEGRPVTAADVRAVVRVSPAMADQLAATLAAEHAVNGHAVTA